MGKKWWEYIYIYIYMVDGCSLRGKNVHDRRNNLTNSQITLIWLD
jgi:hypothetical protein